MPEKNVCYYIRDMKFSICCDVNIKWNDFLSSIHSRFPGLVTDKSVRVHERYYDDSSYSNLNNRKLVRCIESTDVTDGKHFFEYISSRTCRGIYFSEAVQSYGGYDSVEEFLKDSGLGQSFHPSKVLYVDFDADEAKIKLKNPVRISYKKAVKLYTDERSDDVSKKSLPTILIEAEQRLFPADVQKTRDGEDVFYEIYDALRDVSPEELKKTDDLFRGLIVSAETMPTLAYGLV